MDTIILVVMVFAVCFSFVVLFGAPYLPTLKPNIEKAFELLDLKAGQTMLELGSGDGRVLKAAAKRGLKTIGYELNPLLVLYSRLSCWRYRKLVKIKWANFWHIDLPDCDGIYTFLLPKYMQRLDQKIQKEQKFTLKLVSFAFALKRQPERRSGGIMLYVYKKP